MGTSIGVWREHKDRVPNSLTVSDWVPSGCLCCITEGQLLSKKPFPKQSFLHYPNCSLSQVGTFVNRMQQNCQKNEVKFKIKT